MLKKGEKTWDAADGSMPGPVSVISRRSVPDLGTRTIAIVPDGAHRLPCVLQDVDQDLLELVAIRAHDPFARRQIGAPRDPVVGPGLHEAHRAAQQLGQIQRLESRDRKSEHVCESVEKDVQVLASRDGKAERGFELPAALGGKLGRKRLARGEQRVPGADGVVDLVRHHADELLEGGPLRAVQLFAELVDQQEAGE